MPTLITRSTEETEALGARVARMLHAGDVLLLRGDLGAGKTAFVRGMAEALGARDAASSPTFALHHIYPTQPALHHFDLYRLRGVEDAYGIELHEYLGEGICAIEWPDVAAELYPDDAVNIRISGTGDERRFDIEGLDGRWIA